MNINNFNEIVDKKILYRGYDYYLEGVVELLNKDNNMYLFQVQGSYMYEVSVVLDDSGEIISSQCDCPYNMGPICKHEVASYYELNKILKCKEDGINNKKEKQPSLIDVLNKLSKEELVNLIIEITNSDMVLKNNILLLYSKDSYEQEIEKCERLICSIVNKYSRKNGYIEYNETYRFSSEMYIILEKAHAIEDKLLVLDVLFLLLNTLIEAYQYADDSDGSIGGLVDEVFEEIEIIADEKEEYEEKLQIDIFNKLLNKASDHIFDDWSNYKIDLLNICVEFADIKECREKLINTIDEELDENNSDYNIKYINVELLKIMFYIIDMFDSKEKADKFILDNIKYTYFKDIYINKYIDERNFDKVIKLTFEWEKSDSNNSSETKWKKIRYSAYKELSMENEQIELAKELLFAGNFEYYIELKELMNENFEVFYKDLKSQLRELGQTANRYMSKPIFIKLIEYENDLDEILQLLKEQPHRIEDYGDRLFGKFPEEVIKAYEIYIKNSASIASKRKDYVNVCWKIKNYGKFAGIDKVTEMINDLMNLYKKRPAFIDELKKIKK
ncbi:MAG: hypothetical protein PHP29_06340 [Tissierellia bacterium]|nr:hypothetical protein [Tissierellia bacterium]